MSKTDDRRQALAALLREGGAASQEELVARLAEVGFPTTQATVSRDLDAIGAIKGKREGRTTYLLHDQIGALDARTDALDRIVAEWGLGAQLAGNLVVMRARPGSAHIIGAAIDAADLSGVAGCIAGDDTLFIALADGADPAILAKRFGASS